MVVCEKSLDPKKGLFAFTRGAKPNNFHRKGGVIEGRMPKEGGREVKHGLKTFLKEEKRP